MTRVAIIGCGRVCQRYHLPFLDSRPDLELVAACDRNPARTAELFANEPSVHIGHSVHEVLARSRPDVLIISTPNNDHIAPALAALHAGVAVLCEKPLAADLEQARQFTPHATGTPLFGVNLPYRFHDLLPPFADALHGREITSLGFTMSTPGDRLWRPCTPWYQDPRVAGGGALLDLGMHALDVLVTLFGPPEIRSSALTGGPVEERAELRMAFGDVPALLTVDRTARAVVMSLTAHTAAGATVLDFRRRELRLPDGSVRVATRRPELAAMTAFFNALGGIEPGAVVPAAEALLLQELVVAGYRLAGSDHSS